MRPARHLLRVALAGTAVLLTACAGLEVQPAPAGSGALLQSWVTPLPDEVAALVRAPDCCAALSGLPWQPSPAQGRQAVEIGTTSPAFTFPDGKSFLAAWHLQGVPRPARLELTSYRSAPPGSLARLLGDAQQQVFEPHVLVLDPRGRIRRHIQPGPPQPACAYNVAEPAFRSVFTLGEPAEEAAYLVVYSPRAAQQREGRTVCGSERRGMSPTGRLALQVQSAAVTGGPTQALVAVRWYPDRLEAEQVGAGARMTASPWLLAVGAQALQLFPSGQPQAAPRLTLLPDQLVRAAPSGIGAQPGRYLALRTREPGPGGVVERGHVFEWLDEPGGEVPTVAGLAGLLAARIAPDQVRERVLWQVAAAPPQLLVGGPGAAARVGDAATLGGLVAAMPCGLCQTGACTPAMLLGCGGLFAVGAVLGALAGGAHEGLAPTPGLPGAERASLAAVLDRHPLAAPTAPRLAACLAGALPAGDAAWQDQGRRGLPVVDPAPAVAGPPGAQDRVAAQIQGYRQVATVTLRRVALLPDAGAERRAEDGGPAVHTASGQAARAAAGVVPEARSPAVPDGASGEVTGALPVLKPGAAAVAGPVTSAPLALVLEADLRLTDLPSGLSRMRTLRWRGPAHSPADWLADDARAAADAAQAGCEALAQQLMAAGEALWAGR